MSYNRIYYNGLHVKIPVFIGSDLYQLGHEIKHTFLCIVVKSLKTVVCFGATQFATPGHWCQFVYSWSTMGYILKLRRSIYKFL